MMKVSKSSNSMEGMEGFQGSTTTTPKVIQDSYGLGNRRTSSSTDAINHSCLIVESVDPSPSECAAYEQYTSLLDLSANWESKEWLDWPAEMLVKPALQSLEMTFRLISSILCDSRPYIDKEEWKRRLETLTCTQLELTSMICEGDKNAPVVQLCVSSGVLATNVAQEVWQRPGTLPVVSRISEESLLPRLGTWKRAEHMVSRIWLAIECYMQRAPFTLGIGEPNLSGKPILEYDKICKPSYVYSFKQSSQFFNTEDHTICTVHQIFEAWIFVAKFLLKRVHESINNGDSVGASRDCWVVERIWKLLADVQNLFQLVDPDDFLCLKNQISSTNGGISTYNGAYCLRSNALRSLTDACKELRNLVPKVMDVEADPKGGPRLQESVMKLFHSNRKDQGAHHHIKVHLLMAFQAIEAAVKRFFFSYQQLVIVVMGSVEMNGFTAYTGASDPLTQIYSEPPYFPSVDGAKTFLSDYWYHNPTTMMDSMHKHVQKAN